MSARTLAVALGTLLALAAPYAASAKQAPTHGTSTQSKVAALRGASHQSSRAAALRLAIPAITRVAPGSAAAVAGNGSAYCVASICSNPQCDLEGSDCGTYSIAAQANTAGDLDAGAAGSTPAQPSATPSPDDAGTCVISMIGCTGSQYCEAWGFSYCEVWGFDLDVVASASANDAGEPGFDNR